MEKVTASGNSKYFLVFNERINTNNAFSDLTKLEFLWVLRVPKCLKLIQKLLSILFLNKCKLIFQLLNFLVFPVLLLQLPLKSSDLIYSYLVSIPVWIDVVNVVINGSTAKEALAATNEA